MWRHLLLRNVRRIPINRVRPFSAVTESEEQFDLRWVNYFNRKDIDQWELRKGINELSYYDNVPEPQIVISVLKACRQLNDFATAVRMLEVVKYKGGYSDDIYNYVLQEVKPVMDELGVPTPEELELTGAHIDD